MKNPIPQAFDDLSSLAEKSATGLHSLQAALGIMHNTETVVRADLLGARTTNNAYQAAKSVRLTATNAQTITDTDGTTFITTARDVLKNTLGGRYSQAWDETGFTGRSLAVPATLDERTALLKSLELYLTAHPAQEVATLVTHELAAAAHEALAAAVSAVNAAWSDQRNAKAARDDAATALQNRLRKLYRELQQFLDDNDPRWLEFGFNVPADSELPDVPEDLIVTPAATGHLAARWSASARAVRYHIYKQVVGSDNDFVFALTANDTTADMNTFTPGMHVKVRVTAVNDAGESQFTDAVEQTVG